MSETPEHIRRQYRNPRGDDGRAVLEVMNRHHSELWDWGISNMPDIGKRTVMDIGCGGGGFLKKLSSRHPDSAFIGVDISEKSLEVTSETNRDLIGDGTLTLFQASVDNLPVDDCSVDVATAVETYFFWPDLPKALAEIHRILSPDGMLFIISEMQLREDNAEEMAEVSELYGTRLVTDGTMLTLLSEAGFEASCTSMPERGWVLFMALKTPS